MEEKISELEKNKILLDNFISEERKNSQCGSGDDLFYELQIVDYVNKQRLFWISFIDFIKQRAKKEVFDDIDKWIEKCKKRNHPVLVECNRCSHLRKLNKKIKQHHPLT